jgi:hypothetical protein
VSYDLIAFDNDSAPLDRLEFLDWIARAFRSVDGHHGVDVTTLPLGLQTWHREMRQHFPNTYDPHAYPPGTYRAGKHAHYRFAKYAVRVSIDWDDTAPAFYRAKKAAMASRVGLFEASGVESAVWMFSRKKRFEIVHTASREAAQT